MSSIVTGDRYLDYLVKFVDRNAGPLLDGTLTIKLNPVGLHYVHSRLEALQELEGLLNGAPVDYLRAYVSDLGDHRALEQLRRILGLLTSLKVISVLPPPTRDPTPVSLLPFGRLKVLELRGCDLSSSAARGLLELRHSLEKLICHNSTDALRHVFASRIVDIKESPVWNRLSSVSCACNGLVFMDESLQLLPAVETLDLSRNQFAKVANLRKCTKLQHLDLGFNHLRSIASLGEVSCQLVKLVLRNNALTTLRGIENLKSVEGIDLSFNIISDFTELEILASLPCLHSLWLEGNPLCCARWYRAHVFSFFSHPEKLILDENAISRREYWERHIILASRQKQPSGHGFYFPAKDQSEDKAGLDTKRKNYYRLASIEDEEQRKNSCSEAGDQESVSCDSDNQMKDENVISDGESEIASLINKIEFMKKERSVLWLREFKEWLDQSPDFAVKGGRYKRFNSDAGRRSYTNQSKGERLLGESSTCVPDIAQASEDDNSSNVLESEVSFTDTCIGSHGNGYLDTDVTVKLGHSAANGKDVAGTTLKTEGLSLEQDMVKVHLWKPKSLSPLEVKTFTRSSLLADEGGDQVENISSAPLTAIDEIMGSRSSLTFPGSPPHYQEDILQRRLYLEEEFLQLSAESQSLASSDSDTSSSEDDICRYSTSVAEVNYVPQKMSLDLVITDKSTENSEKTNIHEGRSEGQCLLPNHVKEYSRNDSFNDANCSPTKDNLSQFHCAIEKHEGKRKQKRRIISLPANSMLSDIGPEFRKVNGALEDSEDHLIDRERQLGSCEGYTHESCEGMNMVLLRSNQLTEHSISFNPDKDQFIREFFHLKLVDSRACETCQQVVRCGCVYQLESVSHKSEVALLRSCMDMLYILLVDVINEGQETIPKVLGCHRLEEVREVVVGLGLQALRVYMDGNVTYLFLPRTGNNSKDLLYLLGVDDSTTGCSLRSWEQVQVNYLEKYFYGGIKMGIVFYSMILFWHDNPEGESWVARSLFMVDGSLLVCIENLVYFSCLTDDCASPYYSLDSCCAVRDILEMVIELKNDRCLTLIMKNVSSGSTCSLDKIGMEAQSRESSTRKARSEETSARVLTWKLKWFSEETLLKFVAVLRALHLGLTASCLHVKSIC